MEQSCYKLKADYRYDYIQVLLFTFICHDQMIVLFINQVCKNKQALSTVKCDFSLKERNKYCIYRLTSSKVCPCRLPS